MILFNVECCSFFFKLTLEVVGNKLGFKVLSDFGGEKFGR